MIVTDFLPHSSWMELCLATMQVCYFSCSRRLFQRLKNIKNISLIPSFEVQVRHSLSAKITLYQHFCSCCTKTPHRHFQNGETTCQLSKRLPDNSTIFAAEATAISLALNYYQHMDPVHHDVIVYSDSISCLQAIEGEDTENPFICHIMNLLWSLSDKGTRVRFC